MITSPPNLIAEITADIRSVADDVAILNPNAFNNRANALDFLDFHIIDRLDNLSPTQELLTLKQWANRIKDELETVDARLFEQLREDIRSGKYTGSSFINMIHVYTGFNVSGILNQPGYDNLDNFINGLLNNQPLPEPTQTRDAEMVFYQQTPTRIIFELAAKAKLQDHDVLIDIGSGLGHVPILLNLISSAKTKGIEFEPAYCQYAQNSAAQLNLPNIEFINADARKADYTYANVFFMYTPFKGALLQDMLNMLQRIAQQRNIRIFTYGPCSADVAKQTWLTAMEETVDDEYRLYEFKSIR